MMVQPGRHGWRRALACGVTLWLLSCSPPSQYVDMGGSEVVGRLITPDNKPVVGAEVKVLLINQPGAGGVIDTQLIASDVSADSGKFRFDSLPMAGYTLIAIYKNDSLQLRPQAFTPDPEKRIDLGILVMKAPGAIRGTVLLVEGGPDATISCYIAGTSFDALTNRATPEFTISGVFPVDTSYELSISAQGYRPVSIADVPVKAGERTTIPDTIRLTLETTGLAPSVAPAGLSVVYDTVSGTAALSWNRVPLDDVRRYIVYSTIRGSGRQDTASDTVAAITVFIDNRDTNTCTVTFQVAALDDEYMQGPRGKIETLIATPPSWLQVKPVIAKVEGMGSPDTAFVVLTFTSKVRRVETIDWWADNPDSIIRRTNGNGQKQGNDTLCWFTLSSRKLLGVTLTDNAGNKWIDSLDASTLMPIDRWATIDSLQDVRRYACACALAGKIYVFGGCSDRVNIAGTSSLKPVTSVEMYDPALKEWKTLAGRMAVPRYKAAAVVVDDRIFVFGGTNGQMDVLSVEQYNPESDTWSLVDSLSQPMVDGAACVINGLIYLTGGVSGTLDNSVFLDSIRTYRPLTGTWGNAGRLITPRRSHQTFALNSTVVVIGGLGANDEFPLNSIEMLNTSGTAVTTSLSIPADRFSFGATVTMTKLVIFGGLQETVAGQIPVEQVTVCNLTTADCSAGTRMPAAREGMAVATLDGRIFVIGGGIGGTSSSKSTRSVYVYYP